MFGRKKIYSDEPKVTKDNVIDILREALVEHRRNREQVDYLYWYYRGKQPIYQRIKQVRDEICNKIVENRAFEIVSFKAGFLCGEPIQYVNRGEREDIGEEVRRLNDYMVLCNKAAKDKKLVTWKYICGTGYRAVFANKEWINTPSPDVAPFDYYVLDPRNTFVVYYSGPEEYPLMGITYVKKHDESTSYSVYVDGYYYEITDSNGKYAIAHEEARPRKNIPIIEDPLNESQLGAFEPAVPLLDAINTIQSNRVDGIEQFIQALTIFTNCDVNPDDIQKMRESGFIALHSASDRNNVGVDILSKELDQTQTQTLIDYLHQTILDIVGMPNRNGGLSTSDTGSAVIMRDGWETAEAMARSDRLLMEVAERQFIAQVLGILRETVGTKLSVSDVDPKFTHRRGYENIQARAQALQMLIGCGMDKADALVQVGIGTDPLDLAKRMRSTTEQVGGGASA